MIEKWHTDMEFWKTVETTEFLFEKECYKTCDSFCCKWEHDDFPRYIIKKSGTPLYLPKEYEYIKSYHNFQTNKIKKFELCFNEINGGGNLCLDLYYTQCSDVVNCNKQFVRPLYCRLYPFFPVLNIEGELLDVKSISLYDIAAELKNISTPCYLKQNKEYYLKLWKQDETILSIFRYHYLLFYFMVANITHDNYIKALQKSDLLKYDNTDFWQNWELAYLEKKLFLADELKEKINDLYDSFIKKYQKFKL